MRDWNGYGYGDKDDDEPRHETKLKFFEQISLGCCCLPLQLF